MQRPLVITQRPKTVQGEMDAFSETDPSETDQQQRIGVQAVSSPEFLLQQLIVLRGEWSGKVMLPRGKILGENQSGWQGMAVVGQVVEQAAELDEVSPASGIGQRGIILCAKTAEPTEQMGIATQLGEAAHLWESDTEIAKKVVERGSISQYGLGLQGCGESLDPIFQGAFETPRSRHRFLGGGT